jgi:hypothetical protein
MNKHARPLGLKKYGTAKPWSYGMERAMPYLAPEDPSEKVTEAPRMVSTAVGKVLLRKKSEKGPRNKRRAKKPQLATQKQKGNR